MSRALNFLWMNLDLQGIFRKFDEAFREPLPPQYIESIRKAGAANPDTQVSLWVDSKRMTAAQLEYLQKTLEGAPNVRVRDLRDIPAYDQEALFNRAELSPGWRNERKDTLIWRQVDVAKVLVSLQGDFDQVFYADLDFASIETGSENVQAMLNKHGILARGFIHKEKAAFENQLWGFDRRRHDFFERLYSSTLEAAYNHENGYGPFLNQIDMELAKGEGIDTREICFSGSHDGSSAYHPGHKWSLGHQSRSGRFAAGSESPSIFDKSLAKPWEKAASKVSIGDLKKMDPKGGLDKLEP